MEIIQNKKNLAQFKEIMDEYFNSEEFELEELIKHFSCKVEWDEQDDPEDDETGTVYVKLKGALVKFDVIRTYDDEEYEHDHVLNSYEIIERME